MAIDWGIALGSAVGTGVDTYKKMQQQALEDLKAKKLQQEFDEENAYQESVKKQAAIKAPSNGVEAGALIDKGIQYENPEAQAAFKNQLANLTPEQQQAALRTLKGTSVDVSTQAAPEGEPKAGIDLSKVNVYKGEKGETKASTETAADRSHEEVMRSVMKDMQASGNMAGYQKAAGIYKLAREVSLADATDATMKEVRDRTERFNNTVKEYGMVGAVEKLGDEFAKNGINLSVVKGKDGRQAVAVLGADGKPVQTFSSPEQMGAAFQDLMMNSAMNKLMLASGGNMKDIAEVSEKMKRGQYYGVRTLLEQEMKQYDIAYKIAQTNQANAASAAHGASTVTPWGYDKDGNIVNQDSKKGLVDKNGNKLTNNEGITRFPPAKNTTYTYVGNDTDGTPVRWDPSEGTFSRADNKPVQDPSIAKKFSGQAEVNEATIRAKLADLRMKPDFQMIKPEDRPAAEIKWLADNGVAPDALRAQMKKGVDAKGNPIPESEYDSFNAKFPYTQVQMPKRANSAIPSKKENSPPATAPTAKEAISVYGKDSDTLPSRLATATKSSSGMAGLAQEAKEKVPMLKAQIQNAEKNINSLSDPTAKQALKTAVERYKRDLQIYNGVLEQQRAKTGLTP